MKVCMISPTLPDIRCGVGDYTGHLVELLNRQHIQISIITSTDRRIKRSIAASTTHDNIEFFGLKKWGFASLPQILKKIATINPDIVHIQYETHMYSRKGMINLLPLIAKLTGISCPFMVTLHEFEGPNLLSSKGVLGGMGPKELPRFFLNHGLIKDLKIRSLITWSDSVIVTNQAHLRHLKNEFPSQKSKFIRIPLGTSLNPACSSSFDKSKFRNEKGIEDSHILLSFFGFLRADKKLDLLFRAVRELLDQGYAVKLLVLASIGDVVETEEDYLEALLYLARQLNIEDSIIWMDYLPPQQITAYLRCSDICILPFESGVSERRTSFITAVSLGLPIITTVGPDGDTIPSDFKDGVNVRLIAPNNLDQLCAAIIELIESIPLRQRMGLGARELSHQFSWDQIIDKTVSTYEGRSKHQNTKRDCISTISS